MDDTKAEQWALAASKGDSDALRDLYDHFSPALFGYLTDMTDPNVAEDLLHQLWLRVMNKIGSRRSPIRPWLFIVARNLAIDTLRAVRQHTPLDACGDPAVSDAESAGAASADDDEEIDRLQEATQRLPALYRDVVLLRHYTGLPLHDIARILDIPLGTVASRLRTAFRELQKELYCASRLDT